MKLKDAIDTIFSHNEVVAIWYEDERDDFEFSELNWCGMAWDIPKQFLSCENWEIFGVVAENITESDRINIRIKTND